MSVPRPPHIGRCQETFLGARIITVLKQLHLGSKCGHRGQRDTMIVYGDTDSDPCIDAEIKSSQAWPSYCKPLAIVCLQFWNNSTSLLESHLGQTRASMERQEACQNNAQHEDPSQFLIELYDNDIRVEPTERWVQCPANCVSLDISPLPHSTVSVWGGLFSLSSALSNNQPPKSLMNLVEIKSEMKEEFRAARTQCECS